MNIYTIYERPADHPTKYVVRRWLTGPGKVTNTGDVTLFDTLELARSSLPPYLTNIHRMEGDDACIVESWI